MLLASYRGSSDLSVYNLIVLACCSVCLSKDEICFRVPWLFEEALFAVVDGILVLVTGEK